MKKVAITTDSNSGITFEESRKTDVFVLPMPILIDGTLFFEGINLSQTEFYQKLSAGADVSTSQPSPGELIEFWTEILKEYDEIVHIPMSSGLSQSCATATMLAKEFDNKVFVVDNRRISVTMKQSVYDACALRKRELSAAEIKEYLEKTANDSSIYIAVDTMKYLKKGGRVTPAAAAIGSILKIKPILQIHGAKLDKYALARGNLKAKELIKQAMARDLSTVFSAFVQKGEMALYVAHTDNEEQALAFQTELKKDFPDIPVTLCDPLSLSVSCHIGPGALALACARTVK